ncbi:MAG: sigma-E factor negative regulatory protein RseC [Thermotogota bacterium]|nr:sigma-E factor negative regulatory protein RseC [Thermotogota bacterium]
MEELVEYGKIISSSDKEYFVEINRAAACGACTLKDSCSVESGKIVLRVPKGDLKVHEGDMVELRIPKSRAVKAAFMVYGIPLLTFIALIALGKLLDFSDLASLLVAFLGLAMSFVFVHFYDKKKGKDFSPKISKVLKV